ncbi:hypothetical protein ACI2JA_03125 [Alkalihalobacillus sp. NPDC078783]
MSFFPDDIDEYKLAETFNCIKPRCAETDELIDTPDRVYLTKEGEYVKTENFVRFAMKELLQGEVLVDKYGTYDKYISVERLIEFE